MRQDEGQLTDTNLDRFIHGTGCMFQYDMRRKMY